MHAWT